MEKLTFQPTLSEIWEEGGGGLLGISGTKGDPRREIWEGERREDGALKLETGFQQPNQEFLAEMQKYLCFEADPSFQPSFSGIFKTRGPVIYQSVIFILI